MKKAISDLQSVLMPGYTGQAFSYGNAKLPKSTLIINLTSAEFCPSASLGLCKIANICYARKCERIYPNYRAKNLFMGWWLTATPTANIIALLEAYIDNAPQPITTIRLDEAGDFIDQGRVSQWNNIAGHFWNRNGIITYTYTCRSDLDFSAANYIIVNGSLPGIQGAVREFKCIPALEYDTMVPHAGEYMCPRDCNNCHMCYTDKFTGTIYCRKH